MNSRNMLHFSDNSRLLDEFSFAWKPKPATEQISSCGLNEIKLNITSKRDRKPGWIWNHHRSGVSPWFWLASQLQQWDILTGWNDMFWMGSGRVNSILGDREACKVNGKLKDVVYFSTDTKTGYNQTTLSICNRHRTGLKKERKKTSQNKRFL